MTTQRNQNNQQPQDKPAELTNELMPMMESHQISPMLTLRKVRVEINPSTDGGEVYKQGSKKIGNSWYDTFALGKIALLKIANAAGIVWDAVASGPIGQPTRDYVLYKAVGAVRTGEGTWATYTGTKEIDLSVIEEELLVTTRSKMEVDLASQYDKTFEAMKKKVDAAGGEDAYVKSAVRDAMLQWRKHKLARAETGAMERVIRIVMSLQATYTEQELKRPFMVPRYDFSPDYEDPDVRRAVLEHGLQSHGRLFAGQQPASLMAPAERAPINVTPEQDDRPGDTPDRPGATPDFSDIDREPPFDANQEQPEPAPEPQKRPQDERRAPPPQRPAQGARSQRPPRSAQQGTGNEETGTCTDCGQIVTAAVKGYSERNHGRCLCRRCQDADKQFNGGRGRR